MVQYDPYRIQKEPLLVWMRNPVNELVFKQTNGGFRIEKYSLPYLSGQTIQYSTWWACLQTNKRWIKKRKCTHCHICLSRQYKCSDYGKSLACMFHWEAADYHLCLWIRKYDSQTQRDKTTKKTIATWKISKYGSQRDKTSKTTDIAFFLPLK